MIYRPYAHTGLQVSVLGFGGMRFPNQEDVDACAGLVKAAYDAGITYFDTAQGYGKSEELMGVAFREMAKTRAERPFYVSTKTFGGTDDDVRRDLETSLKRLQVDAIDFYHVWCLMTPEAWATRKAKGVLRAFERAKAEGLIKHIVVSSHMKGRDIAAVLQEYPFEGVLLGYSAMNFAYREEALAAAHRLGRAVVVMNPLGGGIIPQHPERFAYLRNRPDESVVEGALRFLIHDPRITVALVGLSNLDQLREAVRAVDRFEPLDDDALARVRAGLQEGFDRLCTGCGYCDECPQGLPVPKLMDAYNQFAIDGKPASIPNRMKWHWGLDGTFPACTACRACEKACTQNLPIVERIKAVRAAFPPAGDKPA